MAQRINIILPEATVRTIDRLARPGQRSRFIDRAVQHYVATASAEALVQLGCLPMAAASAATAAGADGALAIARFIASVVDRKLRSVEFLDSVIAPATRA